MLFLKSHKFYQTLLLTTFLSSCASRGPGYAAREELYDKLAQPEMMANKESAVKGRTISSQQTAFKEKRHSKKGNTNDSKVMVDDLDLNIVPATSSSSGKGFLLND